MLRAGLSMLWETGADPAVALRERFGLDGPEAAGAWIRAVLDEEWGIAAGACSRVVISAHNAIAWVESDRGDLVVKWSRAHPLFSRLEATTRLLAEVADTVPVAAPIPARDGRTRVVLDAPSGPVSIAVLPEVRGDWLDPDDPDAVRAAGSCLATLHGALARIDDDALREPAPAHGERIAEWLRTEDPGRAPAASARLHTLLADAPELADPPQLVHHDFRAANILTREGSIVAVLDFDEVTTDLRVEDLARASVYLATLFTDWGPTSRAAREALRAGYEEVRPLAPAEARWLEILTLFYGLAAIPDENPQPWLAAL